MTFRRFNLYRETILHALFWVFYVVAVNVSWNQDWFDPSLRPNTPSPLATLLFPIFFYAHAHWAMPRFLLKRRWWAYAASVALIFGIPEWIRLLGYALFLDRFPHSELFGRDSFLFGGPSPAWMAFIASLIYRWVRDVLLTKSASTAPAFVLDESEARTLTEDLDRLMREQTPYLNQKLDLDGLAALLSISDKKLSALLNQQLNMGFSEYVNSHRVHHFIRSLESGQWKHLSLLGLAEQCGFSSKTTFYRAFKLVKGCTPSEFVVSNHLLEPPSRA